MIFVLVACIVLLILGREELGPAHIVGVVAFLLIAGYLLYAFELQAAYYMSLVALLDVYLVIKVFGSDIRVR